MGYVLFAGINYQCLPFYKKVSDNLFSKGIDTAFFFTDCRERWVCRKLGLNVLPKKRLDVIKAASVSHGFEKGAVEDRLKYLIKFFGTDKNYMLFLANRVLGYLTKELTYHSPDLIVIWNGTGFNDSIITMVAKKHRIKLIFCENGYLPNTMQIDPEGANWYSSITNRQDSAFDDVKDNVSQADDKSEIIPAPSMLQTYSVIERCLFYLLRKLRISEILDPSENFSMLESNVISYLKRSVYNFFINEEKSVMLPEKYIFLPFQVQKDSQIFVHSPYIKNMREFVALCVPIVKRSAPEYKIVVKEHPEDFGKRKDYNKLRKEFSDIIWLRNYPVDKIIKNAALVITINSTVGYEAILQNKPVVTLGRSFYNRNNIVLHAETVEQIPGMIREALTGKVDEGARKRFTEYLKKYYFINSHPKNISKDSVNNFTNAILNRRSAHL